MIRAVLVDNFIVASPEAFLLAFITSICISVFGLVLLFRELVMRKGQRRIRILGLGMVSLFWPLYIWVGYINVLLYIVPVVGPIWFIVAIWIASMRSRKNDPNPVPLLVGAALLNALAIPILMLHLLRWGQFFPQSNHLGSGFVIVAFLFFPLLLVHGLIIRFLMKMWAKDRLLDL